MAVPEVQTSPTASPEAKANPRAKKPAERSSAITYFSKAGFREKENRRGAFREPGDITSLRIRILHANGQAPEREAKKTEGKEDPCAELKKRLARLEAEKQAKKAKKKPATAARKTTPKKAAKKPTTKKTTVAKAKKPSATSIKTSTRKTAGKDAWIAARHRSATD